MLLKLMENLASRTTFLRENSFIMTCDLDNTALCWLSVLQDKSRIPLSISLLIHSQYRRSIGLEYVRQLRLEITIIKPGQSLQLRTIEQIGRLAQTN